MATQSPFSLLNGLLERFAAVPQPPQWLVHEVQQRLVLFLNHVLIQEKEATDRLLRQRGRIARLQWRGYSMALCVTPAGLLDLASVADLPDLHLEITETSPLALAQVALRGEKPAIRIEGDVQLAAEINWLVDHVQWDLEEDLARLIGDAPAHMVAQAVQRAAQALRLYVGARFAPGRAGGGALSEVAVPGSSAGRTEL
ncbi:MAG: hypothetical protein PHI55_10630 [Burkholderiaceae bacterium]|nr:hypothetical protein [Burkholderiaceae bacterium]